MLLLSICTEKEKPKSTKTGGKKKKKRRLLLDQSTFSENFTAAADRGCNLLSRCDPKVLVFFCLTYFSLTIKEFCFFFLFQTKEQQEQVLNQSNKVFLYCAFLDYRWVCLRVRCEVLIVDSLHIFCKKKKGVFALFPKSKTSPRCILSNVPLIDGART